MAQKHIPFPIVRDAQLNSEQFDVVVVISHCTKFILNEILQTAIHNYAKHDGTVFKGPSVNVITVEKTLIPSGLIIYSATGPVNRDFDDVRRFFDAGVEGLKRALKAGCKKPLVVLPSHTDYPHATLVTLSGVLYGLHTPLEIREAKGSKSIKVERLGVASNGQIVDFDQIITKAIAIECGKVVQRDIMASDPVRMAPPKCAEFLVENFANSAVKVDVVSDQNWIEAELPCFAAVNRACRRTPEFHARLVTLTYEGEGPIEETLMFVGKGVTFDSGGIDVKTNGHMIGMHRDKGGAATVAGLFEVLNHLRPKNLKVIGLLPFVRNTIAPEGYTCDEIITARSGKRIRIINSDAEGRMIMVDCLCMLKEKILKENITNAHMFTVATLTGHAYIACGPGYSIIVENGPANKIDFAREMQISSESIGDPFEVSKLRREDVDFAVGKSEYEDVHQCHEKPSSQVPRGHQFALAFLISGSGLDEHGLDSKIPLKFSHIDMAGADGPFPGVPYGQPIAALTAAFLL